MTQPPVWLTPSLAIAVNESLLAEHGGGDPACDATALDAALAAPARQYGQGVSRLFTLAARYAFGIARDRPFGTNSERVALVLAGVFLELNGWRLAGTESDAASVTRALAAGELDASAYAMWLEGASRRHVVRRP